MTKDEVIERLQMMESEDSILFDSPDYETAILGITDDGRVCYSYSQMIEYLMSDEGGVWSTRTQ